MLMNYTFDLISDLFLTNDQVFNWKHQATSLFCIVAGNIAADREKLVETLTHLGECYKSVFYIDGYYEHLNFLNNFDYSYEDLTAVIDEIPNVIYLQNKVIVADGIAILGTNGWWSHDFDPGLDYESSCQYTKEMLLCDDSRVEAIQMLALNDYNYLEKSIEKLQRVPDVKKILLVTSTVPSPKLISHDPDLHHNYKFNTLGNSYLQSALAADTEQKVHTWCFGTYGKINACNNSINYISNAREKEGSKLFQTTYYPSRFDLS